MPAPPVNTGDVRHGGQRVNSLLARLTLRGGARGRRGLEAGGGRCPGSRPAGADARMGATRSPITLVWRCTYNS